MMLAIFCLLLVTQLHPANSIPSTYTTESVKHSIITPHANALPVAATIQISKTNNRKKKAPNIPLSIPVSHHIQYIPNLHVIPLQHHIHAGLSHFIGNNKVTFINQNGHATNNSHTLIPVLIPIHNLVPVHDLTVIPLHRVDTSFNNNDERERYRNPLGGYGAGWGYGGHGAGHGFHYAYG